MEPQWKYVNDLKLVAARTWPDGKCESTLVSTPEVQEWLQAGNVILEPDLAPE